MKISNGRSIWIGVAVAASLTAAAGAAHAQAANTDEDLPPITLSGAGVQMLRLAVPRAEGDSGAAVVETMSKDMDITGLFQVRCGPRSARRWSSR